MEAKRIIAGGFALAVLFSACASDPPKLTAEQERDRRIMYFSGVLWGRLKPAAQVEILAMDADAFDRTAPMLREKYALDLDISNLSLRMGQWLLDCPAWEYNTYPARHPECAARWREMATEVLALNQKAWRVTGDPPEWLRKAEAAVKTIQAGLPEGPQPGPPMAGSEWGWDRP